MEQLQLAEEELLYPITVYYNQIPTVINALPDEPMSLFYDQILSLYSFNSNNDFSIYFEGYLHSFPSKIEDTRLSLLLQPGDSVYVIGGSNTISDKQAALSISEKEDIERYARFTDHKTINHVGIANIGNTCYFGALLQALYALRPFRELILNHRIVASSLETGKETQLLSNLKQLFTELVDAKTTIAPSMILAIFKQLFPTFASKDKNGLPEQQDSAEALLSIFQALGKSLNVNLIRSVDDYIANLVKVLKEEKDARNAEPLDPLFNISIVKDLSVAPNTPIIADKSSEKDKSAENEVVTDSDRSSDDDDEDEKEKQKEVESQEINKEEKEKEEEKKKEQKSLPKSPEAKSLGEEISKTFDIHINRDTSHLQTAIEAALVEKIEEYSEITHVAKTVQRPMKVNRLPEILTFQFCRFAWDKVLEKQQKITRKVSYPLMLDMFQFSSKEMKEILLKNRKLIADKKAEALLKEPVPKTTEEIEARKKKTEDELENLHLITGWYRLSSVVAHKGMSANSGHYVSYIRTDDDQWAYCNDDSVEEATEDDVMAAAGGSFTAYLAFYTATAKSI